MLTFTRMYVACEEAINWALFVTSYDEVLHMAL